MIPRNLLLLLLLLLCSAAFGVAAATLTVDGVEFAYRLPAGPPQAIMVLFGGRNWKGGDTLKRFRFDELADRHRLILLSPSFRDHNYWEPEKWSGPALKRAVAELERRCRMPSRRLLLYGYSAGGQCANLFYAWMPEKVAAWGAHACGVYFTGKIKKRIHLGFDDPSQETGTEDFIHAEFCRVRDEIKNVFTHFYITEILKSKLNV